MHNTPTDLTVYKNCGALTNSVYISNEIAPYKPCCWFKTGIAADSKSEYHDKLSKLDIEYNCSHCIKLEESGSSWSHRQLFNDPKEFVIGVCFDNICNLQCVTCSPVHTSRLIQEWEQLEKFHGDYDKKYYTKLSKQAPGKLEFIKTLLANNTFQTLRLEIFGGEPLINPTVFKFIDWIAEQPFAKQTTLSITTNGTTVSEKIEEYTRYFKHVGLQLSIDGINAEFEYLRYGASFATTVDTVNAYYAIIDKASNFTCSINYTLSWMNCLHFAEFYNWVATSYPLMHLHLTKLEGPDYYSVNLLSTSQRNAIVDAVLEKLVTIQNDQFGMFEKLLLFYKQSMQFTLNDNFDSVKFDNGLVELSNIDGLRNNMHLELFAPIIGMIK